MASDLIISENNRLVRQDIITQNTGYKTSERYRPIPTQEVLNIIKEIEPEYKIVGFNNANVRIKDKDTHQKHALMIQFPNAELINGTKMNMVLFNSSDRSMSLRILAGAIRAVCNNGMVWADSIMQEQRIRHTKEDWRHSIYSLMEDFHKSQGKAKESIIAMQGRYMSYGDQGRLAERIAEELINPNISGRILDPQEMLVAQRKEDVGKNLWLTQNRIQEYMSQGGLHRIIMKEPEDGENQGKLIETISKTHKITDEAKRIKMNKKLNEIILEYV